MKAAFTLIPAESRRLIAKAVVETEEIKRAKKNAYILLFGGTSNGYVAQELLGYDEQPQKFTAGTSTQRVLCVTDKSQGYPFPIVLHKGERVDKTLAEAMDDYHRDTVIIKGGNAVDPEGNVGVIAAGSSGGTVGATWGTAIAQGLKYIYPVGLEKMIASVQEASGWAGAKTLDYSMGADFGLFFMPKESGVLVTEIEALKILAGVEAKHIASGGIGQSAGAVVLIAQGEEAAVKRAIGIVESVKGEPTLPDYKRDCEDCPSACTYAGKAAEELPQWLQN